MRFHIHLFRNMLTKCLPCWWQVPDISEHLSLKHNYVDICTAYELVLKLILKIISNNDYNPVKILQSNQLMDEVPWENNQSLTSKLTNFFMVNVSILFYCLVKKGKKKPLEFVFPICIWIWNLWFNLTFYNYSGFCLHARCKEGVWYWRRTKGTRWPLLCVLICREGCMYECLLGNYGNILCIFKLHFYINQNNINFDHFLHYWTFLQKWIDDDLLLSSSIEYNFNMKELILADWL